VTSVVAERDTIVETYFGEEVHFVDTLASVDTMFVKGEYAIEYVAENGCNRILNVVVTEVARPYAIAEVQGTSDASPVDGKIVEISGTVTGVAAGEGFFVQDAVAPWSGIWVEYSDVSELDVEVGDGVKVTGTVAEVASVTTVVATNAVLQESALEVTPIVVTPTDAKAEKYESVRVKVEGARGTAANTAGEWTIYYLEANKATVNDWLYAYSPVKDHFYHVTGIVNGRLDAFKLEPVVEADVVDLTATPVGPKPSVEFKVYPNPFNDHITIDNNDMLTRVVVVNVAGQRVIDIEYPDREIRTANLVSGVYVISLYTENGVAKTERIIKR